MQHLFNGETPSDKAALDGNFTELYGFVAPLSAVPGSFAIGLGALGLQNANSMTIQPAQGYAVWNHASGTAAGTNHFFFGYGGASIGGITQSGTTGVTYNTSSDYRLKDSVAPIANSATFIDALKPCTWTWKSDGSAGSGFIAHELQAVSPNSVTGAKDAVDGAGKPVYQSVEYGSAEVIAMLVAEMQAVRVRLHALDGH